jgi:predicted HAD superfamily phosphohydrolase YqeG
MNQKLAQQVSDQGMSLDLVQQQLTHFAEGFPFLPIVKEATIGDGIIALSEEEITHFKHTYPEKAAQIKVVKFVPASGAASRMFKDLFSFLESDGDISQNNFVSKFITHLEKFAFYADLDAEMRKSGSSINEALEKGNYKLIVATLLNEDGLGYGQLPKGLLKFHHYEDHDRTPTYEHFVEGVLYALGKGNTVRLHFTVSPEHEDKFKQEVAAIQPKLEQQYGVQFEVSYSQQKKSTDTIAVNMDNTPFEEEDGSLLFRPAGHGALLENLNDIDADLIFIKNIDNEVPDRIKEPTKDYKRAIGGLLLQIQEQVFKSLKTLDQDQEGGVIVGEQVLSDVLGGKLPDHYQGFSTAQKSNYLKDKLNRPLRVCGMVKNTGEPGGGPFWVQEDDGSLSLQIAETAQIDLNDSKQKAIFQASTHFNPVDLVCATKDYMGNKFDLLKFRDMRTGFITEKSKSGRNLKALELPGLWNGSMAGWNTLFVEVPLITFNPVKTVNDLLREEHQ